MTDIVAKLTKPAEPQPRSPMAKEAGLPPIETGNLEVDKDIPVSLYESRFNRPFVTDLLGLKDNILSKLDTEKMGKLRTIDRYILESMSDKNLEDSKESYKETMDKLLDIMEIDKNEKSSRKIDKLHAIILLRKLFN